MVVSSGNLEECDFVSQASIILNAGYLPPSNLPRPLFGKPWLSLTQHRWHKTVDGTGSARRFMDANPRAV